MSVYRYFLSQGDKENLRLILAWWEAQGMPRFNPFDTKTVGQPNLFDVTSTHSPNIQQEALALVVNNSEPILIEPTHQYNLQTINTLAIKKFNSYGGGQSASWAFNVEALEQPRRFQVIQAASQRAYEILERAIKNVPQVLAPVVADEEALKSAIRGLINSSQVKPEAVQIIANALENQQISQEYWHSLFDGQGAKTAISQKIYSPQMVRLITLRAMVIPETITEFLAWLNVKSIKDKADENQNISLEFQKSVRSNFPKENLADGIKYILPKLLNRTITPESVYWLLIKSGSAWVYCQKQFLHDIVNDLEIIRDYFENTQRPSTFPHELLNCNQEIWKKLINYWKLVYFSNHYVECYKPFAELFEYIKEYSLSAYFYQVSEGRVPKNVFYEVAEKNNIHANYFTFLDLTIEREVTWLESFINFIFQEYIVPIQLVIPFSILIFLSGLFVGSKFLSQQQSTQQANQRELPHQAINNGRDTISEYPSDQSRIENSTVQSQNIPINKKEIAMQDVHIQQTSKAVKTIIKELKPNIKQQNNQKVDTDKIIIDELKKILNVKDLNYAKAIKEPGKEREKLVEAIYLYQLNEFDENAAFGYMESGKQTPNKLKDKIKNNLGI
ncbi:MULTISPECIES: hypothetical protein [unclassified Tolypothrix]|uniref:hypothetical protein n=1 Tax=unclassified Tolypothrix TaxID=2649714 RepID=UPI001D15BDEA|nr:MULTISPECIES: hypothetical protein [unclassified Tolypothrix]